MFDAFRRQRFTFEAGSGCVSSLALSPDGRKIVVGGRNRMVGLYDSETGNEILEFPGNQGEVSSVAFSVKVIMSEISSLILI